MPSFQQLRRQVQRVEQRRILRLFLEARDAPVVGHVHDAERLRLVAPDRDSWRR